MRAEVRPEITVEADGIDVAVRLRGRVCLRVVEGEAIDLGFALIAAGGALAARRGAPMPGGAYGQLLRAARRPAARQPERAGGPQRRAWRLFRPFSGLARSAP